MATNKVLGLDKNVLLKIEDLTFGHVVYNELVPWSTYALYVDTDGNVKESEPNYIEVPIPLKEPFCEKHGVAVSKCGCVGVNCQCI